MIAPDRPAPTRVVHQTDGVAWLAAEAPLPATHAIVTSLPDASEVPGLGAGWRDWFIATAAACCRAVADDAPAIFYQTDVKADGRWIDKGHLVSLGADQAGSALLFHKIVCRVPPGTTTFGRPAYAHILGFSRALRVTPQKATPDVLPELGEMTWSRAMGTAACHALAAFVRADTACTTVVDPFCGLGTMLAAANAQGLDAIGVELSRKRAERARKLRLTAENPTGGPARGRRSS